MKRISPANAFAYTLFILSGIILLGIIYFLSNVKVITDWTLTLPPGDIHVGDTVVIQSTYTKIRPAAGESIRYIECQNNNNVWVRYELNRATANRGTGKGGTGIVVLIRHDIADVPTTCRFTVIIRYDVLPLRPVYVSNSTKEFRLLVEGTSAHLSDGLATTIQRTPSQAPPASVVPSISSYQSSPIPETAPSNTSQSTINVSTDEPEEPVKPSLLQQLTNTIWGIL